MALLIRVDVDRPFGRRDIFHKLASRISSDLYLPRIEYLHFLHDLNEILDQFNLLNIRSYVFFRRCTLPSIRIMKSLDEGNHVIGLHLENSRSLDTFKRELEVLEKHIARKISVFSKHGSGVHRYGLSHYAPYEPKKYILWGKELGMHIFFGNGEDPSVCSYRDNEKIYVFPSAFWLEPFWRDTTRFSMEWLAREARLRDIVLLLHPDNITRDRVLMDQLMTLLKKTPTTIYSDSENQN